MSVCTCLFVFFHENWEDQFGVFTESKKFQSNIVGLPPSILFSDTVFLTFPRPIHLRYGSVNPGSVQGCVCLWQFTILLFVLFWTFSFVFVFETGSHCRGLGGTHRDPPAPLSQPPVLRLKALLFCSFETGSHYISLTGIHRTKYGCPTAGWLAETPASASWVLR